jgi:glycosyltransferase involved in cell wall biosynthesis
MNLEQLPYISICIPVYNGEKFIRETIQSVLHQNFKNFELIILDNASIDRTAEIIREFNDSRIKFFSNNVTISAHQNWSKVVSLASAPWTKLLCADDLLVPEALDQTCELINEFSDLEVFVGTRNVIDEYGREVRSPKPYRKHIARINQFELTDAIIKCGSNPIGESCCVVWKSELTRKVGPFSEQWEYFIDIDYWLRLAAFSDIGFSPAHVASFRVSSESWTANIGLKSIREAIRFFGNHECFSAQTKAARIRAVWRASMRAGAKKGFSLYLTVGKKHDKK